MDFTLFTSMILKKYLFVFIYILWIRSEAEALSLGVEQFHYHNYDSLHTVLSKIASKYKSIAKMISIGRSVEGRHLWALQITDKPDEIEEGEPMFKYVGNMHGNEVISREILINLIEYLCENYEKDQRVTRLVNTTNIFILPSMNPDGFEKAEEGDCEGVQGRSNANGIDLNRDFPDQFTNWHSFNLKNAQPETQAMMKWIYKMPFVLSANLHGGSVVASYPFDDGPTHIESGIYSKTPDDAMFKQLALVYAQHHPIMKTGNPNCGDGETFMNGITNGAHWYDVPGGMQDFNYLISNCFEITVELSCCKYPRASELVKEWHNNKESLLSFLEQVHKGIKGTVKDSHGEPIPKAKIIVDGIPHNITTINNGWYWRLLVPGKYTVRADAEGFESYAKHDITVTSGYAKQINFVLKKKSDTMSLLIDTPEPVLKATKSAITTRRDTGFIKKAVHINQTSSLAPVPTQKSTMTIFKKQVSAKLMPLTTSQVREMFKMTAEPSSTKHHNYVEMVEFLNNITSKYPKITKLYSVGKSVEGRNLWVMEISDNPGIHEPEEPEFRYIANMHGNEVVGRECLLSLMEFLCKNYRKMVAVTSIVDNTRIHLMPSMNPDGYQLSKEGTRQSGPGRLNKNGVDLNRDFPDQYDIKTKPHIMQPETKAVVDWIRNGSFVLSANLHGGALLVNYPFDDTESGKEIYNPTPDDELFKHLARVYSEAHPIMHMGKTCPDNEVQRIFPHGITNGADWYNVKGGLQDYSYLNSNDFEITIEMGCFKFPPTAAMNAYWNSNKIALVRYITEIHRGIKGMVTDSKGRGIQNAVISVTNNKHMVQSLANGDYFRILLPGKYEVTVAADGYYPLTKNVIVSAGLATNLNFQLALLKTESSGVTDTVPVTQHIPDSTFSKETISKQTVDLKVVENSLKSNKKPEISSTWKYHQYDNLVKYLKDHEMHFPNILKLNTIGKSKEGKLVYSVELSNDVNNQKLTKPNIGFIAMLHGYDMIGQEILLMYIHHLTKGFQQKDRRIMNLLRSVRIHIIPAVNVDGISHAKKADCNGSMFDGENFYNHFSVYQKDKDTKKFSNNVDPVEVQMTKKWMMTNNLLFSAVLEAGDLVVRYPLDDQVQKSSNVKEDKTSDDLLFQSLARTYASKHIEMKKGKGCLPGGKERYPNGVIRGIQWKQQKDTLSTYAYTVLNSLQLSLHISCCQYPDETEVASIWQANKEALISLSEQGKSYVHGSVKDLKGHPVRLASIFFDKSNIHANVSNKGEFFKYMLPGKHSLRAESPNFESNVKSINMEYLQPAHVDFMLHRNPNFQIHTYESMKKAMQDLSIEYPNIAHMYSIGKSVEGRDLWVLEISDNPGKHEAGEPEFKYVAGIHGNEIVGRELLLLLSEHLCKSYGHDHVIDSLVNNTRIHILPLLNPDGAMKAVEGDCHSNKGGMNANGIDLNEDFLRKAEDLQPETKAISKWMKSTPFVLSANLQGSSLVVSYPYDSSPAGLPETSPTQDDDLFRHIATKYAEKHPTMHHGRPLCPGQRVHDHFPDGITNGAKWSSLKGTYQDYSYDNASCFQVTIHTGCCKYPQLGELQIHWQNHKTSLINYIKQVHSGIKGFVFDSQTMQGIPRAEVRVNGRDHHVRSADQGDYWRLLLPGSYKVSASAYGYEQQNFIVHVHESPRIVNFILRRKRRILGIRPLVFVALSASAVLVLSLIVYMLWRFCWYRKRRTDQGFVRLDKQKMNREEFFDDMGIKSFNSKNLLAAGFYSDGSDVEQEVILSDNDA